MMNMDHFAETVVNEITKRLNGDYEVSVIKNLANNGVVKSQLYIRKGQESACHLIHLKDFYEEYEAGQEMHIVIDHMLNFYHLKAVVPDCIKNSVNNITFEQMKDKIMFKLVNTADNQKLLEDVPSIPYLDLSIVFYIYFGKTDDAEATALIRNEHLDFWGISTNELYQWALVNTSQKLPPILCDIGDMLKAHTPENLLDGNSSLTEYEYGMPVMLVLSNQKFLNGAAVILYPNLMKQCQEKIGSDFIILPSSMEEVILVPVMEGEDSANPRELANMIQMINENEVPEEYRLSNHAYRYCSAEDQIICA